MWRFIRNVAFWACVSASIVFAALWVRSYYWRDKLTTPDVSYWIDSWYGKIRYVITPAHLIGAQAPKRILTCRPSAEGEDPLLTLLAFGLRVKTLTFLGFGVSSDWRADVHFRELYAPHWFFLMVAAGLALALKGAPRWKFGLRDMMILTTLVAVVAGAFAGLGRLAD